jgi:hypothetical protein
VRARFPSRAQVSQQWIKKLANEKRKQSKQAYFMGRLGNFCATAI